MTRALLTLVALLGTSLLTPAGPPTLLEPGDFVEYWSAARVHAVGGNPYDGRQILPLQRELLDEPGRTEAIMLWTPPWTLPLYTPFGVLPPAAAQLAWLATQGLLAALGLALLGRVYGSGRRWSWLVGVGLFLTTPELFAVFLYGQNSTIVFFGLAGFLYLRTRGYPLAAGLVGALTAVKPHLLLPFAALLLLDLGNKQGRRVILGGAITLVAGSLLAMLPNRDIFADFAEAMVAPTTAATVSVKDWKLPLASYWLRVGIDPAQFRWQFLPAALACAGYAVYRLRLGASWDWRTQLPGVVFVSLLTAPYGCWIFDLVLLLVPLAAGFHRVLATRRAVPIALAIALDLLRYPAVAQIPGLQDGWWITPVVLGWYLIVRAICPAPRPVS